jgi:hypothetical protein
VGTNDGVGTTPRILGTNNYTVQTNFSAPLLNASSSYVVSSTLAGSFTATFNKTAYNRGENAVLTICARDLGGRIVPDTLMWTKDDTNNGIAQTGPVDRYMLMEFNVEATVPVQPLMQNFGFQEQSEALAYVSTTNGCAEYLIRMPGQNVDFTVEFSPSNTSPMQMVNGGVAAAQVTENGWASTVSGPSSVTVKVGDGGDPTPPPPPPTATIMIEGIRGSGGDANRVFVEGTTTNLVGATVVPHYRFPGQVGFTAGVGLRTVDSLGNFAWQRKTGKRIAVQFRNGDTRSNSIIIAAR